MRHGGQVAAALLLDALVGEPPEPVHPTVLMGRAISAFEKRALRLESARRLAGIVLALSLPSLVFVSTRMVLNAVPGRPRWLIETAFISTTLSMRGLAEAAMNVERELREGRLETARVQVSRFVGRDTQDLSEQEVCRAAVESVAENASDGVVGPMLYGLLFGAPGALAYRAVNTLDSMVGYKQPPYAEIGWASARLDDVVNLAPSRATVLATAAVSGWPMRTLAISRRYGPLAASPNAGRVEAAFAGALGVRLGGTNSYGGEVREGPDLGEGPQPEAADIVRAVRLMRLCCAMLALLAVIVEKFRRG